MQMGVSQKLLHSYNLHCWFSGGWTIKTGNTESVMSQTSIYSVLNYILKKEFYKIGSGKYNLNLKYLKGMGEKVRSIL